MLINSTLCGPLLLVKYLQYLMLKIVYTAVPSYGTAKNVPPWSIDQNSRPDRIYELIYLVSVRAHFPKS